MSERRKKHERGEIIPFDVLQWRLLGYWDDNRGKREIIIHV